MAVQFDVFADPVHRRFAIRIILMIGMLSGAIAGVLFPWWLTVAFVLTVSAYVTLLTIVDMSRAERRIQNDDSETEETV
jgi:uncharacterized membrane protein YoaK (UPF0700 family)